MSSYPSIPAGTPSAPPVPPVERAAQRALTYPLRFAGLHSCYQLTSNGRCHFYDSAPGSTETPAVLLHGLGALGISLFTLAALLRRKRRVVVPDLFHFLGLSEPIRDQLDTDEHVDAIYEFVLGLHVGSFDLCGHSAGGGAAVRVALRAPERTRSLVLMNPGGFSHSFESLREDILSLDGPDSARRIYDRISNRGVFRLPVVRTIGARATGGMFGRAGVRDFLGTIQPLDFVDSVLRDLKCKTLLLWGDEDGILPKEIALHIATETPDVEAYWVKGGSHILPIDAPFTVYQQLLRFWGIDPMPHGAVGKLAVRFARPLPVERIVVPGRA
jgi:pimeloyl-ACP methyl ester carboxylesterase